MFDLTNIRSDDSETIAQAASFLADNADPGVRARSEEQLKRAIDAGQGLIIQERGKTCGVSLVYKYEVPLAQPIYSEVGTMRITANGFGFQVFLAALHLLQIRVEDYDTAYPDVFAVVSSGTASDHNLQKLGMAEWVPPDDLAAARRAAGIPFLTTKSVIHASPKTFGNAFELLRNLYDSERIFRTPKNDGRVQVDLGWFSSQVLAESI